MDEVLVFKDSNPNDLSSENITLAVLQKKLNKQSVAKTESGLVAALEKTISEMKRVAGKSCRKMDGGSNGTALGDTGGRPKGSREASILHKRAGQSDDAAEAEAATLRAPLLNEGNNGTTKDVALPMSEVPPHLRNAICLSRRQHDCFLVSKHTMFVTIDTLLAVLVFIRLL